MTSRQRGPSRFPGAAGPWLHGPIPVFGLVGGMGAGKSLVATRLEELGAHVIDADKVGHALLEQRPVREAVIERFGKTIVAPETPEGAAPAIDRKALGAIVFADPVALRALEAIVHPAMRRTFEKAIDRVIRRGQARAIVLEAAILYEAGWDSLCDKVVFVDAPRSERLARLAVTRGWDEAALSAREQRQAPLDQKKARADLVITNDGSLAALRSAIGREWNPLRASSSAKPRPLPDERLEGREPSNGSVGPAPRSRFQGATRPPRSGR